MTSPCEAVLTSSPTMTFTPNSAAFSAASRAPEISLWSVTAIAPSPCVARGREQHLDRRRAVRRVVGVHVQVDVDLRAGGDPAAHRPVRRRLVAPRGQRRVHGLELLGEAVEAHALAHARAGRGQRGAQRRVADEAPELGGEHVDVARLEQQAALALADELLVDRQPRRDRDDAGADRGEQDVRARARRRRRPR